MSNYFALEILEYSLVPLTRSKPKEIEVLHHYEPTSTIDSEHGEPYHATISQNRTIAISTMTMFSDTPVKVTDTPVSTGSLTFTVSAFFSTIQVVILLQSLILWMLLQERELIEIGIIHFFILLMTILLIF